MITQVRLKNWRSHLDSVLGFSTGTNALLGSMGSGKTSVLDSICFALFGTFPTLQSKKLKLDDIIMKKPIVQDKTEVEILFSLDGSNYSVKRIIEKGKGTTYSEIRQDGKLLEAQSSVRVTELLNKILKINYELFSKAIYSEQNAIDYFLTIPKGQRMKKIDELLMIDKFEKARANTVSVTNKIVERKLALQKVIEEFKEEELEKVISELKISLNQILNENIQIQKSYDDVLNRRMILEKELATVQHMKENLELMKRDERGISSTIDEINLSIKSIRETLKEETKDSIQKRYHESKINVDESEKELRNTRIKYEKLNSEFSQLQAKIDIEKEKITKLGKIFEEKLRIKRDFEQYKTLIGIDITHDIEEKKNLHEKLITDTAELKVKIENIEQLYTQLLHTAGKCPICDSKLGKQKRTALLKQKKNQLRALEIAFGDTIKKRAQVDKELKKLDEHSKLLNEMQLNIRDFDSVKEELESSKKNLSELLSNKEKYEKLLEKLKEELDKIENKLNRLKEEKQNLEIVVSKLKEYEEKVSRLSTLQRQRDVLFAKISNEEKTLIEKNVTDLENEYKELIVKQSEYQTKLLNFEQLIKEKNERIKDFEGKVETIIKYKSEVKKLENLIIELKIFEKSLEETQIGLRKDFILAVNYSMNNLWSTLYPYQDFTGIRLNIEEGDYVLQLQERSGNWVNVEGIASGGERSIASLALRIAFALVLAPQLRWLVLDEPTANLDAKSISELAATLRDKVGEFVDQCFLITHQPELEEAVTGNAYRLERDKVNDGVTKVIQIS